MRPNFKKPHHIASWHLRCIRHRRHRYCSDLFDLVISRPLYFCCNTEMQDGTWAAFERWFPGSVQNTSHEHSQVQLDSTIRFQILGASRTRRSELHDHVSLSSIVCVCIFAGILKGRKFGYTYFRDLSGHVSSCNSEDVMAIYRRDSLQDWLKHQGTFLDRFAM